MIKEYESQNLVTTLQDMENVFKLMQENNIAEVCVGNLVIRTRQTFPFQLPGDEKGKAPVSDDDILRNPYAGLPS